MMQHCTKIVVEPFAAVVYVATSDEAWEELGIERDEVFGVVLGNDEGMFIALPEEYRECTTWHEAHHAARWLTDHYGVPTNAESHEIDVYLQEHIVRLIKSEVYDMNEESIT